jgi:hypothetical protein
MIDVDEYLKTLPINEIIVDTGVSRRTLFRIWSSRKPPSARPRKRLTQYAQFAVIIAIGVTSRAVPPANQ